MIGFLAGLSLVLAVLKGLGLISWSWPWIFAPLVFGLVTYSFLGAVIATMYLVSLMFSK